MQTPTRSRHVCSPGVCSDLVCPPASFAPRPRLLNVATELFFQLVRVLIALQLLAPGYDNNNDYLSFAIFVAFQPDIQQEFNQVEDPRYEISVR